ncbi:hypothetical protein [Campylobacter fetus]|uniref:DUF177 domain-containing protein n=1 Tax=Campylobacter fetus TaxID=196 RepID=A0A5L4K9D9_CAMFE|nr:hypothetical protein [Campylobacter fetus]EAI4414610.1 hypothetical protein [Campylobacter fetus]EAI5407378.1 hypothetical protein [Campylobacter fetus]EAJ0327698.1 hypothetical protein [Campylobacter fetus]EAJ1230326.1 hypothetical protein [Campylobacter fetus]EAK0415360.1 hypothetical protein [Campylobacter fetus]
MKIPFDKITSLPVPFEIVINGLKFNGNLKKINPKIVECIAVISGNLNYYCDRCGKDMILNLNEDVKLSLSNGIYKDLENDLSDTIEFYDGEIDIDEIFESEIEAYKSGYFYCYECKILKGE